jgi:uncharacterized protein (TIGR02302 family)
MLDPFDEQHKALTARISRTRFRTFWAIVLERLTLDGWRIATWCGFFGGLWLFRIPAFFGTIGALGAFFIFIAGLLFFIRRDFSGFRFPDRAEIDRRIEQESGLRHRPLMAMKDTLANAYKSRTRMLWVNARSRIVRRLGYIRSAKPQAFMAAKDPHALRLGVLLFFALSLYIAGPSWNERLMEGLIPLRFENAAESPDRLALWVTPPQYTGLAPLVIKGRGNGNILEIPAGSTLKITVRGGRKLPKLVAGQNPPLLFSEMDKDNYILETKVSPGKSLNIRQGLLTRAKWNYRIIPDERPVITLKGKPEITTDGPLRFPLEVGDDYGVKTLTLSATLNQSMNPAPLGQAIADTRIVMSPPKTALPIQPVYDLTAHPWAGQPVTITFTAEDGAGQSTVSTPMTIVLPERPFMHPVAKAIIKERKRLILNPVNDFGDIAQKLETIMVRPGYYLDDKVVFLALRAAASHLIWADPPKAEDARDVAALLWDTALRVEGGEISIAARNLRDAQRDLEQALENPAMPQEKIDELIGNLRSAMSQYFMEMQREMQKRMAEGQEMPMIPPEMMGRTIDPDALSNFLEQLEQKMKSGDTKGAQEMMAQFQRLMDMMDPSMARPMPEDMQMMAKGINELQELVRRQKDLLAQTQSQMQSLETLKNIKRGFGNSLSEDEIFPEEWNMDGLPPAPVAPKDPPSVVLNTSPHKTEQEALRFVLGRLMTEAGEKLGEVPEHMSEAEQEMRGSSAALGENNPLDSIPHQQQTLEHLEQAQKQMSEHLTQRLQQMTGFSMGGGGMKFDPLGRPYGGDGNKNGLFGSPVKIPDASERKRAQEILDLLRKRSGELNRPDEELDYYKRLLRQF